MTERQKRRHYHRKTINGKKWVGVLLLSILCGFTLGGCDNFFDKLADLLRINGNQAQAQAERERDRVQILSITPNEFRIQVNDNANASPSVATQNGFIVFTMQSSGLVFSGNGNVEVLSGDQVILQPGNGASTGTVTIIFDN